METAAHPFCITCAVDRSEYAPVVLTHLFDAAVRHGGADCHVVMVVPDHRRGLFHGAATAEELETERGEAQTALARLIAQMVDELAIARAQRDRLWLHVRRGDPAEQIVELAAEAGADLIVVGRFGGSGEKVSPADRVIERAECPVLVVQGTSYAPRPVADQCADCVAIRRGTRGEQWFCHRHHGESPVLASSFLVGHSLSGGGSGSGWL
jgi:nucleotide-binding universal stress UspA family protein